MDINIVCQTTYTCDNAKHHRVSRNLADNVGKVLNNLKRKRILGLRTLYFLCRIERDGKN